MRLMGYRQGREVYVAAVNGDGTVRTLAEVEEFWEDPFTAVRNASADGAGDRRIDELHRVPPVRAGARVLCVGLNYAEHVAEGPYSKPDHPTVFGRWTASLAVSGTPVAVPVDEPGLDWEAELLAVVGRPLHIATPDQARQAVFAYACFNDITARRAQKLTTQWTIGKNVDGSGPMSELVTVDEAPDPASGLRITTRVNGIVTQDATTDQMIFPVPELLAFLSRVFELRPGDLLATGTPSGVGYARTPPWLLGPGDEVEVEIEGIGSVRTPIVEPRSTDRPAGAVESRRHR